MRQMHWSEPYLNFITIEITYSNGAIQTWDYECIQYITLDALKLNMTQDFTDARVDRQQTLLSFKQIDNLYSVDLENTEDTGQDFTDIVFGAIEGVLSGD